MLFLLLRIRLCPWSLLGVRCFLFDDGDGDALTVLVAQPLKPSPLSRILLLSGCFAFVCFFFVVCLLVAVCLSAVVCTFVWFLHVSWFMRIRDCLLILVIGGGGEGCRAMYATGLYRRPRWLLVGYPRAY